MKCKGVCLPELSGETGTLEGDIYPALRLPGPLRRGVKGTGTGQSGTGKQLT